MWIIFRLVLIMLQLLALPDSRLLALLQYRYSKEKQKNVATLKIWGTDTVKLLYSSKPFYFSHLDYTYIVFANQNLLSLVGILQKQMRSSMLVRRLLTLKPSSL